MAPLMTPAASLTPAAVDAANSAASAATAAAAAATEQHGSAPTARLTAWQMREKLKNKRKMKKPSTTPKPDIIQEDEEYSCNDGSLAANGNASVSVHSGGSRAMQNSSASLPPAFQLLQSESSHERFRRKPGTTWRSKPLASEPPQQLSVSAHTRSPTGALSRQSLQRHSSYTSGDTTESLGRNTSLDSNNDTMHSGSFSLSTHSSLSASTAALAYNNPYNKDDRKNSRGKGRLHGTASCRSSNRAHKSNNNNNNNNSNNCRNNSNDDIVHKPKDAEKQLRKQRHKESQARRSNVFDALDKYATASVASNRNAQGEDDRGDDDDDDDNSSLGSFGDDSTHFTIGSEPPVSRRQRNTVHNLLQRHLQHRAGGGNTTESSADGSAISAANDSRKLSSKLVEESLNLSAEFSNASLDFMEDTDDENGNDSTNGSGSGNTADTARGNGATGIGSCIPNDGPSTQATDEQWARFKLLGRTAFGNIDVRDEVVRYLIDRNVTILQRALKSIVALRTDEELLDTQHLERNNDIFTTLDLRTGQVLQEVQETVELPTQPYRFQRHPESVVLDLEVCQQLHDYVTVISKMYRDNPFHNFEHASHVCNAVNDLLAMVEMPSDDDDTVTDIRVITTDPWTQFALVFAALVHDVDHAGVPNAQLIKEKTHVASAYRNKSVAEQNSVELAWNLLLEPCYQDLRNTIFRTTQEVSRFRGLVVTAVMATDIADKELAALRKGRVADLLGNGDGPSATNAQPQAVSMISRKATFVLETIIQAADVSHTMQSFDNYKRWNRKLYQEMYLAYKHGRAEKDPTEGWYKGDIGFFDFYIIPLAKKLELCGIIGCEKYVEGAQANRDEWERIGESLVADYMSPIPKSSTSGLLSTKIATPVTARSPKLTPNGSGVSNGKAGLRRSRAKRTATAASTKKPPGARNLHVKKVGDDIANKALSKASVATPASKPTMAADAIPKESYSNWDSDSSSTSSSSCSVSSCSTSSSSSVSVSSNFTSGSSSSVSSSSLDDVIRKMIQSKRQTKKPKQQSRKADTQAFVSSNKATPLSDPRKAPRRRIVHRSRSPVPPMSMQAGTKSNSTVATGDLSDRSLSARSAESDGRKIIQVLPRQTADDRPKRRPQSRSVESARRPSSLRSVSPGNEGARLTQERALLRKKKVKKVVRKKVDPRRTRSLEDLPSEKQRASKSERRARTSVPLTNERHRVGTVSERRERSVIGH